MVYVEYWYSLKWLTIKCHTLSDETDEDNAKAISLYRKRFNIDVKSDI